MAANKTVLYSANCHMVMILFHSFNNLMFWDVSNIDDFVIKENNLRINYFKCECLELFDIRKQHRSAKRSVK
jgi:hypothetical protein